MDKSWTAKGIEVATKLEQVRAKDARVALQLELQWVFGLRSREAMQLQPHRADKGHYLAVNLGTKGGRDRVARLEVAEELGHSRESITTHYLGR